MPLIRIYHCVDCGEMLRAGFDDPVPEHCGHPAKWKQTRDYHPELHGRLTGQTSAAIGFRHTSPWEVPLQNADGSPVRVESLREIRAIERETEKLERDGVGEALHFRAFSQDVANGGMQRNTFGEPPQRAPKLTDAQGRQKISVTRVDGEPVEMMGPGADEALASALGPGMGSD